LRRSALIILVAGIVGVLLFLATRTNESRVRAPAPESKGELVEPRRELVDSRPTGDRTEVAPLDVPAPSELDESAGWRVCVLDTRTNAAVAGATVSVSDSTAFARELEARGIGSDTIAGRRLRRELTVEALTGAEGCVRFRAPPEHAFVEARLGAEWAIAVVNQAPPDHCVTLKLVPDRAFPVRVADGTGTPVGGVPVALRRQVDARPAFDLKWTDTEAGTGVATFLHFQRRLAQGAGWHALLAFPVRDQQLIPVDESTSIEPPITLVMPDTGRVRVRVRTPEGKIPDLDGVDLHLDTFERQESGTRLWPDGPWARPHLAATGDALVPWIGLGLQLKVALIRDEAEVFARSIAGPARPGEEVLCELVWSRPPPTAVTGRFVLRDGRAWPAATVKVQAELFPTPTRWPPQREIAVENDGRFRMPIHEVRPANGTRAFRFSAPHPDGRGEVLAIVPLDQDVPPEGLDLGDVLLDYGELLASGRVVDPARRPIAGAFLLVHVHTVVSGKDFWPGILAAGTTRTATDGEFALYLPPGETRSGDELQLTTNAKGFVCEERRVVRRGERNVEIVLAQAGALAGSLELDRGLSQDDVALFLSSDTKQYVPLRPDSTFEMPALLPGTYSMEVRRCGANGRYEREPAALVEGLLVLAGETCRDPRIQGLRITSLVPGLRIRVVDRASTPLRGAAISIVGLAEARAALSGDDGLCVVRSEILPVDLDVSAFGYQKQRLVNVSADREVVLEAGIPIRLRTSARPSGGEPKYMLGVMLSAVDANGVRRGLAWGPEFTTGYTSDRSHFDERGELALRMPAAGVYECDVQVTVLGGGVGRGAPVELSPKPRISVLASGAEQLFELAIPAEAVQAAVEIASR
jgi:hypothetical protein